jgi:hypothetical protein
MEFSIPWQKWNVEDIQYGLAQINTRIEGGLFVPIYFVDNNVKCQAFHVLTPELTIQEIETTKSGVFAILKIPHKNDFGKRLQEFDVRNLQHAAKFKSTWGSSENVSYETGLKKLQNGDLEWRLQIPDSGIFSCYDTSRKSWYGSNEAGITSKRHWKIMARTSGLWINQGSFGMDWKLIGAFVI